jgi:hypothetical protein
MTTRRNPPNFKDIAALTLRVWREAATFFLSIELGLMLLVVAATVGGVWLAVMHDVHSLARVWFRHRLCRHSRHAARQAHPELAVHLRMRSQGC